MNKLTLRQKSSRANGALSRGPKTEAGKRRVATNAMRHGLLSKLTVLPDESKEIFETLLTEYCQKIEPADDAEFVHIEEMAVAVWRMRRLWAIETRLLANAAAKRPESDPMDRITGAFSELSRQPELHLLLRYEGRFQNMFHRALQHLATLGQTDNYQTNPDSNKVPEIKEVSPDTFSPSEPRKSPEAPQQPAAPEPIDAEPAERAPIDHAPAVKQSEGYTEFPVGPIPVEPLDDPGRSYRR